MWILLQGQVRLSKKVVYPDKPQLGMVDCWYHPNCFIQKREELGFRPEFSASQLMGFSLLTAEDQETLKKQLPAIKGERWVEGWGWRVSMGLQGRVSRRPRACIRLLHPPDCPVWASP